MLICVMTSVVNREELWRGRRVTFEETSGPHLTANVNSVLFNQVPSIKSHPSVSLKNRKYIAND